MLLLSLASKQEYLLKLLGRYREFVSRDAHADHYEGGAGSRPEADGCLRSHPHPSPFPCCCQEMV